LSSHTTRPNWQKKNYLSFLRVSKFDNTDFSMTLWLLIWRKVYKTNVLLQGPLYLEQTLKSPRKKCTKSPKVLSAIFPTNIEAGIVPKKT
jgi:hypothetical protein